MVALSFLKKLFAHINDKFINSSLLLFSVIGFCKNFSFFVPFHRKVKGIIFYNIPRSDKIYVLNVFFLNFDFLLAKKRRFVTIFLSK